MRGRNLIYSGGGISPCAAGLDPHIPQHGLSDWLVRSCQFEAVGTLHPSWCRMHVGVNLLNRNEVQKPRAECRKPK